MRVRCVPVRSLARSAGEPDAPLSGLVQNKVNNQFGLVNVAPATPLLLARNLPHTAPGTALGTRSVPHMEGPGSLSAWGRGSFQRAGLEPGWAGLCLTDSGCCPGGLNKLDSFSAV